MTAATTPAMPHTPNAANPANPPAIDSGSMTNAGLTRPTACGAALVGVASVEVAGAALLGVAPAGRCCPPLGRVGVGVGAVTA
jgi:hypothetical protein